MAVQVARFHDDRFLFGLKGRLLQQQRRSVSANSLLNPPQQPQEDFFTSSMAFLSRGIMAVGLIYCFSEYVGEITLCEGPSMVPTLRPYGEIVWIDKFSLWRIHHSRSFFSSSKQPQILISQGEERIRRALERQAAYEDEDPIHHLDQWHEPRISVSDLTPTWSTLWQLLTTPLSIGDVVVLQHPNRRGTICKRVVGLPGDVVLRPRKGLLVIPDGHMWIEGDNPANSSDSRTYGAIPMALIQGRVLFRVWPLRGNAIMLRGAPPRHANGVTGYTILPAGYEGQHLVKTLQPNI